MAHFVRTHHNPTVKKSPTIHEFVLTVVHMPPTNRARSRNLEFKALMQAYTARHDVRLQQSLDQLLHIIAGDFNMHPADEALLSNEWRACIPSHVPTMATSIHAYDNFVINASALKAISAQGQVQQLNRLPEGKFPSDHNPISLKLSEIIL